MKHKFHALFSVVTWAVTLGHRRAQAQALRPTEESDMT